MNVPDSVNRTFPFDPAMVSAGIGSIDTAVVV
jgi:hypothetical protein